MSGKDKSVGDAIASQRARERELRIRLKELRWVEAVSSELVEKCYMIMLSFPGGAPRAAESFETALQVRIDDLKDELEKAQDYGDWDLEDELEKAHYGD